MTEQNKPKIDLKARLGKKTVSSPSGPSIPPPVGLPRPSGIPAPPFQRSGPKVDANDPYSSIDASSAPRAEPQAIKVEMSDEVRHEQKKQMRKALLVSVATFGVGLLLGVFVGGGNERNSIANQALRDANQLGKDVKGAVESAESLAEVLKSARDKLSAGKYPDEEVAKLGGMRIPFDGANLGGKNIGRFKGEVTKGLLAFAGASEKANDQVETIQRLLAAAKKPLTDAFAQGSAPKVQWAAIVGQSDKGPWMTMTAVPEPFEVKADKGWPESVKFKIQGKDATIKRYAKGDPTSGGDPMFIPIDPGSQSAVCPQDTVFRVARQLQELEETLRGVKEASGHEETGLVDAGRALEEKLKSIGTPG